MPITCQYPIHDLSQEQFDAIDHVVMGHAFATQNGLGQLCDEAVYENDLALRLRESDRIVATQVPIFVTHGDFTKVYRLNLVCDHSAVYDLKTASAFTGEYKAQVLNYAMLLDIRHVKLVNFRNKRVEGQLCFNPLTTDRRHDFHFNESKWKPLTDRCGKLKTIFEELVRDWGAFLDFRLYQDALVHFMGGESECIHRIDVVRNDQKLGTHRVRMHASNYFFIVTALSREQAAYQKQIEHLLCVTAMRGVQWINLSNHEIQFTTIA